MEQNERDLDGIRLNGCVFAGDLISSEIVRLSALAAATPSISPQNTSTINHQSQQTKPHFSDAYERLAENVRSLGWDAKGKIKALNLPTVEDNMAFKKIDPTKKPEPGPLEPGYTRIAIEDLIHSTDKARFFLIDGEKKWIPKSMHKMQYGFDLIDVKNSFYDQHLA